MNEAMAQALASIIQYLGATPILLFFAIMGLAPWASLIWLEHKRGKRDEKVFGRQDQRFEQVVKMYEDNVSLVKSYDTHVVNQREISDKLIDLVAISTGTQQTLVDYIKNNWWCPVSKDPSLIRTLKERANESGRADTQRTDRG